MTNQGIANLYLLIVLTCAALGLINGIRWKKSNDWVEWRDVLMVAFAWAVIPAIVIPFIALIYALVIQM